jgi:hypothetical protein
MNLYQGPAGQKPGENPAKNFGRTALQPQIK